MTKTSTTSRTLSLLSPRTADYVSALIREGDNFDYYRWLQDARAEETQAKKRPQTTTLGKIRAVEINPPIGTPDCRKAPPNRTRLARPMPGGVPRSYREHPRSTSVTRITRRLEKIRDAWDDFQASRARDAVYGYLEAVFAIVEHYRVRRRTKRLRRRASEFVGLPFDKNADPFTAVIRCTSGGVTDNKTISKWARALRYVARCKVPPAQLEKFMKAAGGINACASLLAQRARQ
jgi:hypothetical protein